MKNAVIGRREFPGRSGSALRKNGHNVAWIRVDAPGMDDSEILAKAQKEKRIIVTFDKDFGELAFRRKQAALQGIILFRILAPSASYVARVAVAALASREDWQGHFAVIENHRIRLTPLPVKTNTNR